MPLGEFAPGFYWYAFQIALGINSVLLTGHDYYLVLDATVDLIQALAMQSCNTYNVRSRLSNNTAKSFKNTYGPAELGAT